MLAALNHFARYKGSTLGGHTAICSGGSATEYYFSTLYQIPKGFACVACGVIAVGALSPQHAAWFHILNVAVVQYWYRAASQQGMPAVYMDMASLATLPKYTCGQLYSLPAFSAKRDGAKLAHDVRHNLSRPTAWEAVMRIRCSKGLRISSFHGHFFIRSSDLLALPQVSPPAVIHFVK